MTMTETVATSLGADVPTDTAIADVRRQLRAASTRALLKALGKSFLIGLSTFGIVLALWLAVYFFGHVSPYIMKSPFDVYTTLFVAKDAADNRTELVTNLAVTLRHAGVGFLAGLAIAIVGAVLFRISRGIENALMPFATLLRSVPLVALAPVIFVIFGLGSAVSVAVIGGIVVLFPALVTIAFGLKQASPQILDVVSVYGGNVFTAVRKVALPGALPSLFAAIRISVPGAITGALLAEMLSTGDGIGSATSTFAASARFGDVWSNVVAVTVVSLALYSIVQVLESIVLTRMGMNSDQRKS